MTDNRADLARTTLSVLFIGGLILGSAEDFARRVNAAAGLAEERAGEAQSFGEHEVIAVAGRRRLR